VQDPARALARRRQLLIRGRCLAHPRVVAARHLDPGRRDAHHPGAWQVRAAGALAHPEGEHVEAVRACDERVRLLLDEVREAVSLPKLVRPVLLAVPLPRKAGAAKDVVDLLLGELDVERRRALTWRDVDPLDADSDAARRLAEITPAARERAQLVELRPDLVPVDQMGYSSRNQKRPSVPGPAWAPTTGPSAVATSSVAFGRTRRIAS
jgi:hypothetical protein